MVEPIAVGDEVLKKGQAMSVIVLGGAVIIVIDVIFAVVLHWRPTSFRRALPYREPHNAWHDFANAWTVFSLWGLVPGLIILAATLH